MPQTEAVKYPFGWFSLLVTLAIIVIVFCIMFFWVRRNKRGAPLIDDKAGDEGEDDGSSGTER
jgi:hypothetical protein